MKQRKERTLAERIKVYADAEWDAAGKKKRDVEALPNHRHAGNSLMRVLALPVS